MKTLGSGSTSFLLHVTLLKIRVLVLINKLRVMKKNLFLLLILTSFIFISCSKDDSTVEEPKKPTLVNTIWQGTGTNENIKITLQFTDELNCVLTSVSDLLTVTVDYTYFYDHPEVDLYPAKEGFAQLKAKISENQMNVLNVSTAKTIYNLKKK